ncbi:hypothetical protein [Leptothoe kymatousa]|uniref:hypothetical protein n=1 Tax=Leptothoe kymatousa TaxID=2651727 RepID=UPI001C20C6F1|nr:hypothetical protein [Leptothoe kymatousa]
MRNSSKKAANSAASPAKTDSQIPTEHDDVAQLVEKLIRTKRLTYSQYQTLSKMVLADGTVDEQERQQINRLFDAIQAGAVRIFD